MSLLSQYFGILGNYQNENKVELTKFYKFSIWNLNSIAMYDDESSFALNDRYILIGNIIGLTAQDLLTQVCMNGIKEIESVQGSLVIVDKIEERVILFRDLTGRLPLYWKISEGKLLWSTSLNKLKNNNSKLNVEYIYKYIIGSGYVDSWEETPYTDIKRVPRGAMITFENSLNTVKSRETHFKPVPSLENLSNEEIYDRYRRTLQNSIVKRKKSPALFETSSGLDSTGLIFANSLSNCENDHSFTFTFTEKNEGKQWLEAKKVADQYKLKWQTVNADKLLPLSHISMTDVHVPEEPSPDFFFYQWRMEVFDTAKKLGLKHIISGYGGDELLVGNNCYIGDILKQFRFGEAWKIAKSLANSQRLRGLNAIWFFNSYGLKPLLGISQSPPSPMDFDPSIHGRFILPDYLSNQEKAQAVKNIMVAEENKIKYDSLFKTQLARELSYIFLPFGVMDSIGIHYSIETHYPYVDKDVIEFILGLPYSYIRNENESKIIQKNTFKDFYPKDFKRGQENFHYYTFVALKKYWTDIRDMVSDSLLCKSGIFLEEQVIDFLESWKFGKEVGLTRNMQALVSLFLWLKYFQEKEGLSI